MSQTDWEFSLPQEIEITPKRVIIYDSEFIREKNYYPKLSLVQLNQPGWKKAKLVDILKNNALSLLLKLTEHDAPLIMHSASQDIELLHLESQFFPQSILDTQIGFSLYQPVPIVSYHDMVQHFLNLELDKSETRSDWLARPLKEKQCQYAADDVGPLMICYYYLTNALNELGRLAWWTEDCQRFLQEHSKPAKKYSWYKLKNAPQKLRKKHLKVAQSLVDYREQLAKENDLPRKKILPDEIMVTLALEEQMDEAEIRVICADYPLFLTDLDLFFHIFKTINEEEIPQKPRQIGLNQEQHKILAQLIEYTEKKALELNIAPETLASIKDLRIWIKNDFQNVEKFDGWRGEIFQPFLKD